MLPNTIFDAAKILSLFILNQNHLQGQPSLTLFKIHHLLFPPMCVLYFTVTDCTFPPSEGVCCCHLLLLRGTTRKQNYNFFSSKSLMQSWRRQAFVCNRLFQRNMFTHQKSCGTHNNIYNRLLANDTFAETCSKWKFSFRSISGFLKMFCKK